MDAKLDRTLRQIHPQALKILARNGFSVTPGLDRDGVPNFKGIPEAFWAMLLQTSRPDFVALYDLCASDFPTYCALLLKIVNRVSGRLTPFIFRNAQAIVWDHAALCQREGRMVYLVVLKARQLGVSTIVAAYNHWELWRGRDVHTLNVAHEVKLAERIIEFFRVFHDNLPSVGGMKPPLRDKSTSGGRIPRSELYYADRRCLGLTYVAKSMDPRGFSARHFGLTEAAFYPSLSGFLAALMPQLPARGTAARAECSVFVETTPNGENDFKQLYELTKEPGAEPVGVFLPWFIHEEYTMKAPPEWRMTSEEKEEQQRLTQFRIKLDGLKVTRDQMYWRHATIQGLNDDVDKFDMEYPSDDVTCFLMHSKGVFAKDMRYLQTCVAQGELLAQKAWKERGIETPGPIGVQLEFEPLNSPFRTVNYRELRKPTARPRQGESLLVWSPPQSGHSYIVGCDPKGGGENLNRDASAGYVLDLTTGDQAAAYRDRDIDITDFTDLMVNVALWYNDARMMPEANGLGSYMIKRIGVDWGLAHLLLHEEKPDEIGVKKNKPGWYTSPQNKPILFENVQYMVHDHFVRIFDRELVSEMSTFQHDGYFYSTAKKNQHDDRLFAFAMAAIGVRQSPKMMVQIEGGRRLRIPNAVDLGLNHNAQSLEEQHHVGLDKEKRGILERLEQTQEWDIPWNPLRGNGVY